MAKFAYNNTKNANTDHLFFELNCGYHPQTSYKEDIDPQSWSKWADELANKLMKLITACKTNLQYAQEL